MKISIIAPSLYLPESWGNWLSEAFKDLGHETQLIDYRALTRELGSVNATRRILNLVNSFTPELTLVIKGDALTQYALKNISGFKILWANDDPQLFDISKRITTDYKNRKPLFDYVLTSSEDCVEEYEKLGVKAEYIPFFCHPKLHYPRNHINTNIDISYIGTYYPDRLEVVKALKKEFKLALYGDQWQHENVVRLPYEDVLNTWCSSKIVLNISQPAMRYGQTKATLRIFEALACGCFVLSDYMTGMADLFKPGKHLDVYESISELVEKARFYLAYEEERKKIAEAGRKEVLEKHTSQHRVERIIEIVGRESVDYPHPTKGTSQR